MLSASPHARLATANTTSPATVSRAGPSAREARADGTATRASVRLKATRTHATAVTETSSSR
jgi:hypothetical protein